MKIIWAPPSPPAGVRKLRRQSGSGPGALGLRYRSLPVCRQTGLPTRQAALGRPGTILLAVSHVPVGTCLLTVSQE
ncbi:MAG: hypothetical protein KatS3mg029_0940 [Saprospiraceae bacterium]|nr:MAG: hypothetical protein KatS3mg029_0940 [Saprospiraceae bacterium]